tara:strand:+ start:181 stop:426 length:246 start_codon:yes stop_codon:yes gene_type:complete
MNKSRMIVRSANPITMLTAPDAARIFVVSLSNTVEAISKPAIEKRTIAVKSFGNFGTFLSDSFTNEAIPEKNVYDSVDQEC